MAMAAAFFETRGNAMEKASLEWFESLPPPVIHAPPAHFRSIVTTFVPVNDLKGGESIGTRRSRQPRTFPTAIPDREFVYYVWPETPLDGSHQLALAHVLEKVTRIGHSSSLVQLWLETSFVPDAADDAFEVWQPDETGVSGSPLRRFLPGLLGQCEVAYNGKAIEAFASLSEQLATATGKQKTAFKNEMEAQFRGRMPASQRLDLRVVAGYRRRGTPVAATAHSCFDDELTILAINDAPVLGCESTLQIATALRGAILSQFGSPSEIPEWVSGHTTNGGPSDRCHLAIMPLPFVDADYADGHMLGAALVFPREVSRRERAACLRNLLIDKETGDDLLIELWLGRLGKAVLLREIRPAPPIALRAETWTRPSRTWTTVTPIVLDRFPKNDRDLERAAWVDEVCGIVEESCTRVGLPRPIEIAINHNAWLRGVPRAKPNGGGYPAYPHRNGNGSRVMTHALLAFGQDVSGPVLLGAGRFLGYGLCKPYPLENRRDGTT
jgi:CRISPR-associated protein Csb2